MCVGDEDDRWLIILQKFFPVDVNKIGQLCAYKIVMKKAIAMPLLMIYC